VLDLDGDEEPIYGDIEIDNFNKLFRNPNLIRDLYGETISVRLVSGADGSITRHVKEDLTRASTAVAVAAEVEVDDFNEMSMYSQVPFSQREEHELEKPTDFPESVLNNTELKVVARTLQKYRELYNKSNRELCDLYTKVSGNLESMAKILDA